MSETQTKKLIGDGGSIRWTPDAILFILQPLKIYPSKKVVGLQAYQPLPLHGAWLALRPGLKSLFNAVQLRV